MAIVKKKGRRYLYTKFTLLGIRVDESTKTNSRGEAQEYEEKRRREIREVALLGKKPSRTWVEAELKWLEEKKNKRSICNDILIFEWLQKHLIDYRLNEITKDVIENIAQIKENSGVTPATVNRMLALLRSVLKRACHNWEWIDKIPHVQLRKEDNKRVRWLSVEEAELLLNQLPRHLRVMAKFTLATGLRAMNVSYLEWSEVDMARKHIIIPASKNKTGKMLGVPLNQDAINVLREQLGKDEKFVFVYKGKPVTQCSTRAWRNALKRAGIVNFRWHDLRHTWASWHIQNGTSLYELAELGGWASTEMVMRYAHLSKTQLRVAADRISGAKSGTANLKLVGNGG